MGVSGLIALWEPTSNQHPVRTADGGATWQLMNFPGISKTQNNITGLDTRNFNPGYTARKMSFCQDPANPDRILWYHWLGGIAESLDAGATWTLLAYTINGSAAPDLRPPCRFASYHGRLSYVPRIAGITNHDGHVWMSSGDVGPDTNQADGFFRSTDHGRSWNALPDVAEVKWHCWGKNAPGVDYPALVFVGFVNNVMGVYLLRNPGAALGSLVYEKLNNGAVNGSRDVIFSISLAFDAFLEIMVGFEGSGYAYSDGQPEGWSRHRLKAA
jgi:hypothetical protein